VDVRELLNDGIGQLGEWLDDGLTGLDAEQLNWTPAEGQCLSIGFNAWHIMRTQDNIVHFVLQRQPPIWIAKDYVTRFGLPKVEQGTGMAMEDARAITISDPELLRAYGREVSVATTAFVATIPESTLTEMQQIRPLGEMPKYRVLRQVVMTHGFMHLGEINALKGMLGMGFFL
jgi:DinB superfamily